MLVWDDPIRPILLSNGYGVMHPQTRGNPRTRLYIREIDSWIFLSESIVTPIKARFYGEASGRPRTRPPGRGAACRLRLD